MLMGQLRVRAEMVHAVWPWFEMQQTSHEHLQIETISGMLSAQKSKADMICVNMGKPRFNWNDIPLSHAADAQNLAFDTMPFGPAFCVNMGNPMLFSLPLMHRR